MRPQHADALPLPQGGSCTSTRPTALPRQHALVQQGQGLLLPTLGGAAAFCGRRALLQWPLHCLIRPQRAAMPRRGGPPCRGQAPLRGGGAVAMEVERAGPATVEDLKAAYFSEDCRPAVPLSPMTARQQRMLVQLMTLPPLTDNATRDTLLRCLLCCGIDVRQATRDIGVDPQWEALPPPVELIEDIIVLAERFDCSPAEAFFAAIMDLTEINTKVPAGRNRKGFGGKGANTGTRGRSKRNKGAGAATRTEKSAADLVSDLWQKQQLAQMRALAESAQRIVDDKNARAAEALRLEFEATWYPFWAVSHLFAATAIAPFLLACFAGFPLPYSTHLLLLLRLTVINGMFPADLKEQALESQQAAAGPAGMLCSLTQAVRHVTLRDGQQPWGAHCGSALEESLGEALAQMARKLLPRQDPPALESFTGAKGPYQQILMPHLDRVITHLYKWELKPRESEQGAGGLIPQAPSASNMETILSPSTAGSGAGYVAEAGTAQPLESPEPAAAAEASLNGAIVAATKAVTQRVASSLAAAIDAGAFPATTTAHVEVEVSVAMAEAQPDAGMNGDLGRVSQPSREEGSSSCITDPEQEGGSRMQQIGEVAEQWPRVAKVAAMEEAAAVRIDCEAAQQLEGSPELEGGPSSNSLSSDAAAHSGNGTGDSDLARVPRTSAAEKGETAEQHPVSISAAESAERHATAGAGARDEVADGVGLVAQLAAYFGGAPKQAPASAALERPAAFRQRHRTPGRELMEEGSAAAEQGIEGRDNTEHSGGDGAQASCEEQEQEGGAKGAKQLPSRSGSLPTGEQQQQQQQQGRRSRKSTSSSGWTVLDRTGLSDEELTPAEGWQRPAPGQKQDLAAAKRLQSADGASPSAAQCAERAERAGPVPVQEQGMPPEIALPGEYVQQEPDESIGAGGRSDDSGGMGEEAAELALAGKPKGWPMLRLGHNQQVYGSYLAPKLAAPDARMWKAAGILVFHVSREGLHLLLGKVDHLRKPETLRPQTYRYPGYWILGGKRKPEDFCAEATAVREMYEETLGILSGRDVGPLDLRSVLWYPPGGYAVFPYHLRNADGSRPDIPGIYRMLLRGRYRNLLSRFRRRRRANMSAGPRPMQELAWLPLTDILEGRVPLHHTLIDMFRRTPLLLFLLEAQQGASAIHAAARTLPTAPNLPAPRKRPAKEPQAPAPAGASPGDAAISSNNGISPRENASTTSTNGARPGSKQQQQPQHQQQPQLQQAQQQERQEQRRPDLPLERSRPASSKQRAGVPKTAGAGGASQTLASPAKPLHDSGEVRTPNPPVRERPPGQRRRRRVRVRPKRKSLAGNPKP